MLRKSEAAGRSPQLSESNTRISLSLNFLTVPVTLFNKVLLGTATRHGLLQTNAGYEKICQFIDFTWLSLIPILYRLQIGDDRADVVGVELEFRHVGMA